ncbi:hypothetical protein COO60DRAFT_1705093 [Scenedesmus sp. NREL 46B-D3]|nr:hypothetical protein COO60DRAFT_1705093 [Scenedesmus sp. NREL 46B-D3]
MQLIHSRFGGLSVRARMCKRPHDAATAAFDKPQLLRPAANLSDDAQPQQITDAAVQQRRPRGRPRKVTPADAAESVTGAATEGRSASLVLSPAAAAAGVTAAADADTDVGLEHKPHALQGARKPSRRSRSSSSSSSSSAGSRPGRRASTGESSHVDGNSSCSTVVTEAAAHAAAAAAGVAPAPLTAQPAAAGGVSGPADGTSGRQEQTAPQPANTEVSAAPAASTEAQASTIPNKSVWEVELRHFMGMMGSPTRPLDRAFILQHCYVRNSPEARQRFRCMSARQMRGVMRECVEHRLCLSANALAAAWRRLALLAEAVADRGLVLQAPQLNKEREQAADLVKRLNEGQAVLDKAAAFAASVGDEAYLQRAQQQRGVLLGLRVTGEAYLREYLRRIAAASRINDDSRSAWKKTPPAYRKPVHEVEARRQSQLLQLQALAPAHPTHLLAEYRQAALDFDCYQPPQQQLMARPIQQLPLLPHLGRHRQWLGQQQLPRVPWPQLQEQLRQQQWERRDWQQHPWELQPPSKQQEQQQQQQQQQQPQRAIKLEKQLMEQQRQRQQQRPPQQQQRRQPPP